MRKDYASGRSGATSSRIPKAAKRTRVSQRPPRPPGASKAAKFLRPPTADPEQRLEIPAFPLRPPRPPPSPLQLKSTIVMAMVVFRFGSSNECGNVAGGMLAQTRNSTRGVLLEDRFVILRRHRGEHEVAVGEHRRERPVGAVEEPVRAFRKPHRAPDRVGSVLRRLRGRRRTLMKRHSSVPTRRPERSAHTFTFL